MKKSFYKALYYLTWCLNRARVGYYHVIKWTPWYQAYICTAFKKYLESEWFQERSQIVVLRRAFEMYFDHSESWFFKRKITRKEKFGIALAPYYYIKQARNVVAEKGLTDYI